MLYIHILSSNNHQQLVQDISLWSTLRGLLTGSALRMSPSQFKTRLEREKTLPLEESSVQAISTSFLPHG